MSWYLMHVSMSCGSLIIIDRYDKCSFLHEYFMQGLEMFEACRTSDWCPGFADLPFVTAHGSMRRIILSCLVRSHTSRLQTSFRRFQSLPVVRILLSHTNTWWGQN